MKYQQLYYSTADLERFYFTGETPESAEPEPSPLAPGVYRIIQGELYRIVSGVREEARAEQKAAVC